MSAPSVSVFVESCKLFDAGVLHVSVCVVAHPMVGPVSDLVSIGVVLFNDVSKVSKTFLLSDFPFVDVKSGSYRKTVVFDGASSENAGVVVSSALSGREEETKLYVLFKGGNVFYERSFELTSDILLDKLFVSEYEHSVPPVIRNIVREDRDGVVSGSFDLDIVGRTFNHVFMRRFREDLDEPEVSLAVNCDFSGDSAHVLFVDDGVLSKNAGVWRYRGWTSAKRSLRVFLERFMDKLSWDLICLKNFYIDADRMRMWEPSTLTWNVAKSSGYKEYSAIRSSVFLLLDELAANTGTSFRLQKIKNLLGEVFLSREAVDLFFDVCFVLLEQCETMINKMELLETIEFSLGERFEVDMRREFGGVL